MKNLKDINLLQFVKKNGELLFAFAAVIIAAICFVVCYISIVNVVILLMMMGIMIFANAMRDIDIWVNIGCTFLIAAIFQVINYSVLNPLSEDGIQLYFGVIPATIICIIIYIYLPTIIYKICSDYSLSDEPHQHTPVAVFVLGLILLSSLNWGYQDEVEAIKYAKEPYVTVSSWVIETHNGETYYVVTTPKGMIAISPYAHPDIRNINSKTQVRFLSTGFISEGLTHYKMLEIKN